MKKLLLSSMMAVAAVLSVNAATETFEFASMGYENAQKVPEITQGDVTLTFNDGGNSNAPAYYNSGTALRMYASNVMTVALPSGYTISNVEFTLAGFDWKLGEASVYNVTPGTLTINDRAATWSDINAESATFSVRTKEETGDNYQWRMVSMTVTYDEGVVTKCSAPKFGLDEGTYYGTQNVELTCNTNGATIVYQINDGAETEYTTPIVLSEVGSYTISAYAKKDGIDNSDKVSATYEIATPAEVSSLAEFQAEGEANGGKIVYKFTFPVTVTYQNASNLYVKDAEGGAMLIYGNQVPKYEVGDVIPAGIMGEYTNFSGLPEMQYPVAESFADATQNVPTYPIAMKAGEITLSDLNKVVVVTGNVDETGKVVTDATGSLTLFYQKAWNVETPSAGEYDVVCAVAVYKTDLQAYPIAFNTPGSGVDDAVAAATTVVATANGIVINAAEACTVVVYNAAGQAVETVNVAAGESTVNVPAGFYIVKAANTVCKVLVK